MTITFFTRAKDLDAPKRLVRIATQDVPIGSEVTSVTFTGLRGNSDEEYLLIANWAGSGLGGGQDSHLGLRFNGDAGANYRTDDVYVLDNGSSGGEAAPQDNGKNAVIGYVNTTTLSVLSRVFIRAKVENGTERKILWEVTRHDTASAASLVYITGNSVWQNTTAEITEIDVVSGDPYNRTNWLSGHFELWALR